MAVRSNQVAMEGLEKDQERVVGMGQIDTVRKVVMVEIDTAPEALNQKLGARGMVLGVMGA